MKATIRGLLGKTPTKVAWGVGSCGLFFSPLLRVLTREQRGSVMGPSWMDLVEDRLTVHRTEKMADDKEQPNPKVRRGGRRASSPPLTRACVRAAETGSGLGRVPGRDQPQ